jgi:hypothetical protein
MLIGCMALTGIEGTEDHCRELLKVGRGLAPPHPPPARLLFSGMALSA